MTELRPCPFCKKKHWEFCDEGWNTVRISVLCLNCGARGPQAMSEEEAIRLWNEGVN